MLIHELTNDFYTLKSILFHQPVTQKYQSNFLHLKSKQKHHNIKYFFGYLCFLCFRKIKVMI